jgi:hypothetical protein
MSVHEDTASSSTSEHMQVEEEEGMDVGNGVGVGVGVVESKEDCSSHSASVGVVAAAAVPSEEEEEREEEGHEEGGGGNHDAVNVSGMFGVSGVSVVVNEAEAVAVTVTEDGVEVGVDVGVDVGVEREREVMTVDDVSSPARAAKRQQQQQQQQHIKEEGPESHVMSQEGLGLGLERGVEGGVVEDGPDCKRMKVGHDDEAEA